MILIKNTSYKQVVLSKIEYFVSDSISSSTNQHHPDSHFKSSNYGSIHMETKSIEEIKSTKTQSN